MQPTCMCTGVSSGPAAEKARLREDGDAGEPLLPDAEPALHRRVAVPGPQRPAVGGRRGEVPGVDVGRGVGRAQRCVSRCVSAWSVCARCATSPSTRIVGGRRSRWPSRPGDDELGVARVRGRVLQDGVLGRRPVRLVQ